MLLLKKANIFLLSRSPSMSKMTWVTLSNFNSDMVYNFCHFEISNYDNFIWCLQCTSYMNIKEVFKCSQSWSSWVKGTVILLQSPSLFLPYWHALKTRQVYVAMWLFPHCRVFLFLYYKSIFVYICLLIIIIFLDSWKLFFRTGISYGYIKHKKMETYHRNQTFCYYKLCNNCNLLGE